MKPLPALSIVIPVYCESEGLGAALREIRKWAQSTGESFEIVLVDDGSPDATWQAIQSAARDLPEIRAFRLSRNFGKESALCAGIERAVASGAVLTMDSDLQHPPSLIPEMVKLWRQGVQVVEAVKSRRPVESLPKKLGVRAYYAIMDRMAGFRLEGASDFKLVDRKVADAWKSVRETNMFYRGIIAWIGFERAQVRFEVPERAVGASKWQFRALSRLAINSIVSFSALPLQLITAAGVGFSIFAVLLGGQALYYKFSGQATTGFTTVIILQLLIGAVLMFGLGIIGQYLAKIFDEVKARPRYIVSDFIESAGGSPAV